MAGPVAELFAKLGFEVDTAAVHTALENLEHVKQKLTELREKALHVAEGFVELVKGTAEAAENIEITAQRAGITAESLQRLAYAGQFSKVSMEDVAHAMGFLAKNAFAAIRGSTQMQEAFARLGISVADLKSLSPEEQFLKISDAIKKLKDAGKEQEGLAATRTILGRGGPQFLAFLNQGAEKIGELAEEGEKLGGVMGEQQIADGVEYAHAMTRLNTAFTSLGRTIAGPFQHAFARVTDWFTKFIAAATKFVSKHKVISYAVGAIALAMGIFATAIGVVTAALTLLELKAFATAIRVAASAALAMAPWLGWALLIAAAIGLLYLAIDDIYGALTGKESLIVEWGRIWTKTLDGILKPAADDPWWLAALKEALRVVTDIQGAWEHLELIWKRTSQFWSGQDAFGHPIPVHGGNLFPGGAASPSAAAAGSPSAAGNVDQSSSAGNFSPSVTIQIQSSGDPAADAKANVKAFDEYMQRILREARAGGIK